jgi:hypothetical protein
MSSISTMSSSSAATTRTRRRNSGNNQLRSSLHVSGHDGGRNDPLLSVSRSKRRPLHRSASYSDSDFPRRSNQQSLLDQMRRSNSFGTSDGGAKVPDEEKEHLSSFSSSRASNTGSNRSLNGSRHPTLRKPLDDFPSDDEDSCKSEHGRASRGLAAREEIGIDETGDETYASSTACDKPPHLVSFDDC